MDDELQASIEDGYQRNLEFVLSALEYGRPPRDHWRAAVHDACEEIARIVDRNAHPDDVSRARLAISALTGIWLTPDEGDALYIGELAE